jgi:hypothetical protein
VRHVAHIGEMRNAYKILVRKHEGKRPLWRSVCRWEGDIKLYFKKIGCDDVN